MPHSIFEKKNFQKINFIKINIIFFLNFKGISPQLSFLMNKNFSKNKHWLDFFYKNSNSKKVCKNFFIFLILLNFFLKKKFNKIKNIKSSVFISSKNNKNYTLLRAPFRHKLSKKHYTLVRYKLNWSLTIFFSKKIVFANNGGFFSLINFLKKKLIFFESNICQQHKLKSSFNFMLTRGDIKL